MKITNLTRASVEPPAPPAAPPPPALPRPQASVKKVAAILDYSDRTVRELCAQGELETNGRPGRGFRIFLDSVATYQERQRQQARGAS